MPSYLLHIELKTLLLRVVSNYIKNPFRPYCVALEVIYEPLKADLKYLNILVIFSTF